MTLLVFCPKCTLIDLEYIEFNELLGDKWKCDSCGYEFYNQGYTFVIDMV
jgi:ribosomal protein L37AE/L43A